MPPHDLDASETNPDPIEQFRRWLDEARPDPRDEVPAALATTTSQGRPSARMVLLKQVDGRGFVFYTNYRSRKGRELEVNPFAAMVVYWPELNRQVRIEGRVERLTPSESDAYFRSRSPGSRLSAIASPQSQVIADRGALEARVAELVERYRHAPESIPRPDHWGGCRILPESIEFWQGRTHRMHDRLRYRRQPGGWRVERLAP